MRRWLVIAAAIAAILTIASFRLDFLQNALIKADSRAIEAAARALHGVVGKRVSEREAVKDLPAPLKEFVTGIKKSSPKARVDSVHQVDVKIEDTARAAVVEATGTTPKRLCDEYQRFCFDLPDGLLHRRQHFTLDTVVVIGYTGLAHVSKTEFREYDPITGREIPKTGVSVEAKFKFVNSPTPKPPIIHLRPLAGIDHRLAPGVGLEIVNLERTGKPILERLTGGVMGYWKESDKEGRLVGQLGYRIYGNLTVGPYVGVSTNGTTVIGAGAAIQIGR